jgi:hypothetical protein
MKTKQSQLPMESPIENITFHLEGEEAAKFREYKARQFLKKNAEAARKLMLERLYELLADAPETRAVYSTKRI